MPKPTAIPEFGVELCHGLMGAGKSYFGVWRGLRVILEDRRPFFTNLPVRWRVLRWYLRTRYGEEVAALVYPLTETHWRAFLQRQHTRYKFRLRFVKRRAGLPIEYEPGELDHLRAYNEGRERADLNDTLRTRSTLTTAELDHLWTAVHGPDVLEGETANWIPPYSVVCLDECQLWHPMTTQASETPDLLNYLTMIRHHCHWLWCMTQEPMRVNNNFRKLAKYYWTIINAADEKLMWGLRLKMVGIQSFSYKKYPPEAAESSRYETSDPIESYYIMPQLPRNRLIFRLYDSFTHLGSPRTMRRKLEETRQSVGLDASGRSRLEHQRAKEKREAPRLPIIKSVVRKVRRLVMFGLIAVVGGTIMYTIGKRSAPDVEPAPVALDETGYTAPESWGVWNGTGRNSAFIDGRRISVGDTLPNGATVEAMSTSGMVLDHRGHFWLWSIEDLEPFHIGERESVERDFAGASSDVAPSE